MKISKKEKYLLGVLGTVLVFVLYYQFIYTPQVEKLEELRVVKLEKEEKYDEIMDTIRTLGQRKGKIKSLNQQIIDRSAPLYPEIIQENLILEIDKLLSDSKLKGTISFTGITVGQVEAAPSGVNSNLQTSFHGIVKEYNTNFKSEISEDKIDGQNQGVENTSGDNERDTANETATANNEAVTDSNSRREASAAVTSGDATTEQIKVSLNFNGTYTALKDFIRLVNNNSRKIVITNISLSGKGEGEGVNGSMNLEFYAIPKLGDTDSEYYNWLLNNTYGKKYPFSADVASGTTIEELTNQQVNYDFIMVSKPISSDLPTVVIGQANDTSNLSYVYADNSGTESIEMVLTEEGGKYYFKYKTTASNYPPSYNGNGIEFKPVGEKIVLNILSTKRLSEEDTSGVALTITNNTKKEVEVIIENEDDTRPRISLASEGNNVKVTKR